MVAVVPRIISTLFLQHTTVILFYIHPHTSLDHSHLDLNRNFVEIRNYLGWCDELRWPAYPLDSPWLKTLIINCRWHLLIKTCSGATWKHTRQTLSIDKNALQSNANLPLADIPCFITDSKRSLGQGNVFTQVYQSFCSRFQNRRCLLWLRCGHLISLCGE